MAKNAMKILSKKQYFVINAKKYTGRKNIFTVRTTAKVKVLSWKNRKGARKNLEYNFSQFGLEHHEIIKNRSVGLGGKISCAKVVRCAVLC